MRNTTRAYLEGCTPKLLWLWLWHANESRHRHDLPQGSIQSCIIGQVVYKSLYVVYDSVGHREEVLFQHFMGFE